MKQKKPVRPDARLFTDEHRTRTKDGREVVVKFRRIPVRDGFDIEAAIFDSAPPREKPNDR